MFSIQMYVIIYLGLANYRKLVRKDIFKYRDFVYISTEVACHLKCEIFEHISYFSIHTLRLILNTLSANTVEVPAAPEYMRVVLGFFS